MAKKSKGLSPKIFSGLSKERMKKGTGGVRLVLKQGETVPVQFMDSPSTMREYDEHQFQDGGKWNYVPCAGDGCPLCQDEDSTVSRLHYKFISNVWNFLTKKVEVLSGPKTLAGLVSFRFVGRAKRAKNKGKKNDFLNMVWDISKLKTQPVSYDIAEGDEDPIQLGSKHKPHDLDAYIADELKRYFGNSVPKGGGKSALDDDDEEDYEDDSSYDRDDLEEMSEKEIRQIAKTLDIKTTNSKTGDKRSKATLIKLILKNQ